ncbi:SIR2-like protein [Niveomyces insectorum RCEF 264]|uniref:SIR2-like protein n=1 Tax=Niveomyces insectorum RCEF 264 TaxID=1081102 RepID=A0A167VIL8_9HYPO|nr:SIR2-like protein [Niveomyces insectorum RCEF 264]
MNTHRDSSTKEGRNKQPENGGKVTRNGVVHHDTPKDNFSGNSTGDGDQTGNSHDNNNSSSSSNSNLAELEDRVNDLGDSWETESIFEDILDDLTEENMQLAAVGAADAGMCTPEEAVRYRHELRVVGPEEFCRRTIDTGLVSAKKLLSAFGVPPPEFLEGEPDESYFGLLSLAFSRELLKRAKLLHYNSVDDAVHLLQTSRNIVVLTGAGISTSLGIPDFRSETTGLYARLGDLGLSDPQEVFDIRVFKDDPTIFYSVARDILPSTDRVTPTHAFIALLQQQGKLLTNYSQNIDNLEAKAGIQPDKLVQCHGSFATASCVRCDYRVDGESLYPTIKAGSIPWCPRCTAEAEAEAAEAAAAAAAVVNGRKQRKALAREGGSSASRNSSVDNVLPAARGRGRPRGRPPGGRAKAPGRRGPGRPRRARRRSKWSDSSSEDEDNADESSFHGDGIMKPDITFFGEALPDEFSRRLTECDRDRADLVIVIGTSLKVAPVSEVVPFMPPHVPQIYISRTAVHHINFDIDLLGDCDVVVAELCRRAGWDLQHEMVPPNQVVRIETPPGAFRSRHIFTDVTGDAGAATTVATTAAAAAAAKTETMTETLAMKTETMLDTIAAAPPSVEHETGNLNSVSV